MDGDIFDYIAPVAGAALGTLLLPGAGTALGLEIGTAGGAAIGSGVGSALNTGIETGNPLAALESGVLSGVGSYAGGELLGPAIEGIGSSTNAITGGSTPGFFGSTLNDFAGNALGDLGSQTIGSMVGSAIGSNVAQNVGSNLLGTSFDAAPSAPSAPTAPAGFTPSRSPSLGLPGSLSGIGNLSPQQQASNIATQGVYGSGQGGEENRYFLNLINNRLVDESGNVSGLENINPVENTYLAQLGLGGAESSPELLRRISQYQA